MKYCKNCHLSTKFSLPSVKYRSSEMLKLLIFIEMIITCISLYFFESSLWTNKTIPQTCISLMDRPIIRKGSVWGSYISQIVTHTNIPMSPKYRPWSIFVSTIHRVLLSSVRHHTLIGVLISVRHTCARALT